MSHIAEQPILIFDFDGTIADTLTLLIDISNQLADTFQFRKILDEDIEPLKKKNIVEIIQYLRIPVSKMPLIMYEIRRQMRQHITEAPAAEGLKNIISQLRSNGRPLGLLTSNSRKNVDIFFQHNNMPPFDFFKTSVGILGKKQSLRQLIREQNINKDRVIYVGDEIRDIEAAHAIGIKIAAVTWGYNHSSALANHKPDYLLHHPNELMTLFPEI